MTTVGPNPQPSSPPDLDVEYEEILKLARSPLPDDDVEPKADQPKD